MHQACTGGRCVPVKANFSLDVAGQSAENEQIADSKTSPDMSLLWFFLLAFGGGLLGVLTPCVFPMIPMTISYFMKHGGKRQAVFYGFSIVLIYVLVGIVLSAIFGEGFANFISTHWLPNVLFTVIFVIFAVSLFGYFEISLPSSWVGKSSGNEQKAGYVGTFFMALTLVLVSFSCTLPIAGAVALGAAGGGFLKPIIGMLGFSLAFALPFTFFAFFPNLLQKLPKSGGWMNTLKVCLAFVELAFALKFLSVPDQTYHWGILDREVYLSLWITIFALMGFYLLGKIRFPFDDEQPVQKSWFRFFLMIADFAFVIYMVLRTLGCAAQCAVGLATAYEYAGFQCAPNCCRWRAQPNTECVRSGLVCRPTASSGGHRWLFRLRRGDGVCQGERQTTFPRFHGAWLRELPQSRAKSTLRRTHTAATERAVCGVRALCR